jgi:dethiobiotin synthetase
VIGAWPANPGVTESGNREALAELAPLRAVLPAGAGAASAAEFEKMSADAFDRDWLIGLT